MTIVVNEELKAYIDPLSPDEHAALERSILAEGCRDALVLWGDLLIDGHNRYGICTQHGLPFETVQAKHFKDMDDVHLWMIDQHLGRRSVSDFQRGVLALRKREIVAARRAKVQEQQEPSQAPSNENTADSEPEQQALATREALARAARLSSTQVKLIETIQQKAAPEVVAAVKAGDISLNAAAAVAQLPQQEQVAAASAGKDELKQAAKRVREAKRKPAADPATDAAEATAAATAVDTDAQEPASIATLQQRVQTLEQENSRLREQVKALQDLLQEKA